jgi:hypothetical protein
MGERPNQCFCTLITFSKRTGSFLRTSLQILHSIYIFEAKRELLLDLLYVEVGEFNGQVHLETEEKCPALCFPIVASCTYQVGRTRL